MKEYIYIYKFVPEANQETSNEKKKKKIQSLFRSFTPLSRLYIYLVEILEGTRIW